MRSLLILFSFVMMLCGCMNPAVMLESGSPFPESPRFSIQPRQYSETELSSYGLRTDGIYVDTGKMPHAIQDSAIVTGYTFYRFWPNGRVMFRSPGIGPLNPSDNDAIDSLRYGSVGYYEFTNDGGVKVEIFVPGIGIGYEYGWINFSIAKDTLWIQSYRHARFHPLGHITDRLGYRFMQVTGLTAKPDW